MHELFLNLVMIFIISTVKQFQIFSKTKIENYLIQKLICSVNSNIIFNLWTFQIFIKGKSRTNWHCNCWFAKHSLRKTWNWTVVLLLLQYLTATTEKSFWRSSKILLQSVLSRCQFHQYFTSSFFEYKVKLGHYELCWTVNIYLFVIAVTLW